MYLLYFVEIIFLDDVWTIWSWHSLRVGPRVIYTSISVSANFHLSAQLYFQKITIQAFILIIFGGKFFFSSIKNFKITPNRSDTYATFHSSQKKKKKIFDWKKNVKPWYPDFPRFEIIIVAKKWFFDDEATQWRIASLLNPSNDRSNRLRLKKKEKKFFFKSSSSTIWNNESNVALSQINKRSF